jgi:protein gp37
MGANSAIEWTTHTFNPWMGCTRVSEACRFCYAEQLMDKRYGKVKWGPQGTRQRTSDANWRQPYSWNRKAEGAEERPRVFCASLADVFEDRPELVPWRQELFDMICRTPNLDWLLLTKRPENALRMMVEAGMYMSENPDLPCPQPNIWIGTSVENQEAADKRIPHLLRTPAAVRFLSCEPLLGPLDIEWHFARYQSLVSGLRYRKPGAAGDYKKLPGIDWVICGGESGASARPMHPDWARSLRDQCRDAGVAFFFKQWGEWLPRSHAEGVPCPKDNWGTLTIDGEWFHTTSPWNGRNEGKDGEAVMYRVGKKKAGRLLDGLTWDEMPATKGAEAR